jgi:formylglycine-generating enzyme required for sulfatase activity
MTSLRTIGRAIATSSILLAFDAHASDYVALRGGSFASVLPAVSDTTKDRALAPAPVAMDSFRLREEPVTNAEFLAFVTAHPDWRRDRVASVFAESRYLSHWEAADALGAEAKADQPVTHVSWFAAQAYCESEGARLPTWYEWEYAAAADESRADARGDPAWREQILRWYATPSNAPLAAIGGAPNFYGVRDLHGLVWEWVDDAGALLVASDSRDQNDPDKLAFCGAGALELKDRDNYAVLMRIALLSSVKAADTTANLGFRCAKPMDGKGR